MDQRPKDYPKASDLVRDLLADVREVAKAISEDDLKLLKEKFHLSVRHHRHEQQRFGKKWKRSREQLKTGFFAGLTPDQQKAALEYRGPENHGDPAFARSKCDTA